MRINNNIAAMITQGAIYRTGRDMGKSLERLSTGLRINRASDDAAGLGVSENLRTQVRGLVQAQRNAQDGIAALNIAEGAANEISAIIQRMRELAIQAANDTLTSTERIYLNTEFGALIDEIDRIASVTNYNRLKLIDNTTGEDRFGDAGDILYIDAQSGTGAMLGVSSISNLTSSAIGINSLAVDSRTNATTAISTLGNALNSVNSARANMGALINRLEHAINNLLVAETNQASAESLIRDVDFASETSKFTRNQILTQSSTAMLAQANMVPTYILALLR